MQGQAPEVMDVIQLDGMRAGLRALVGAGLTAEDAAYKLYGEIADAQGKESEYFQSAAICWLVSEAQVLADGVACGSGQEQGGIAGQCLTEVPSPWRSLLLSRVIWQPEALSC